MTATKYILTILAVVVSLLSTVSAQCSTYTSTATTYIANPTSCSAWIACSGGKVVNTGTCSTGYLFNSATGACAIASSVTCPSTDVLNICQGLTNIAVSNPDNCKGYYYCIDGIGSAGLCNTGYVFNSTTKVCDYNPTYTCPAPASTAAPSAPNCANVPDGTFLASTESCSAYYVCVSGKPIPGSCNTTIPLYFDVTSGTCASADSVSCSLSGGGASGFSVTYNYTAICGVTNTTAHFSSDPGNCTGYFYCSSPEDTAPSHGYCPNGLYFDASTQECTAPAAGVCTLEPCVGKPVGYFDVDSALCEGFYYCSASGAVQGNCTTGYYFDVANQNCNTPSAVTCLAAA